MAKNRFIPDELPLTTRNNPKFRAEVLVYDELKSQLDASQRDWIVVHQAKWLLKEPGKGEPKEGEADFLLAHPNRGVLVVDVKGGLILLDKEGQWRSRDRYGVEHAIDPFGQVARNARNLAKKFNELAFWKAAPVNRLGRLVVFPDSATPANAVFPSDVSSETVVDKAMMGDLVSRVFMVAQFWFGPSWNHPRASRSGETLAFLFGTPLEFTDSLGANLPLETRQFEKLTDDQFRVVRAAAKLPRVAVRGGAGSGKTWLARKRAIQLHAEGFRTLLMCRSEPLANHLRSITKSDEDLVIAAYGQLLELVFGHEDIARRPRLRRSTAGNCQSWRNNRRRRVSMRLWLMKDRIFAPTSGSLSNAFCGTRNVACSMYLLTTISRSTAMKLSCRKA